MNRTLSLFLSLTMVSFFLFGCQENHNISTDTNYKNINQKEPNVKNLEINNTLKIDGIIKKVSILKGTETTNFEDEKSIETFSNLFSSAVKVQGIVNMASPEYKMEVKTNKDLQSFYLWIGKKGEKSTLMKTSDNETIYTLPKEITNQLIELLK